MLYLCGLFWECSSDDIAHFPKLIGHGGRHRGRRAQRLMDANEIIIHREQRDGAGVVLNLFEKALVIRVKRLVCIRTLRFDRSPYDVLMCLGSGLPSIGCLWAPIHSAGL
jgi:hypothetical protein